MALLRRTSARAERLERAEAATLAQRVAVMLEAGVAPDQVWALLETPRSRAIAARVDGGEGVPAALAAQGPAWSDLAAAWGIALAVGAPLAEALRSAARALGDAVETIDDVDVALAEPAGTARIMLWLPVVGLGLGAALGFDPLRALTSGLPGFVCLVLGVALIGGARLWTRALVARAQPVAGLPGISAELFAIALSGGVSIDRARELVGAGRASSDVDAVLSLSRRVGVPAVELLRAEAAEQRRTARASGRRAAAALATRLLLPLGVCTLPAFLLLGGAPLLLAVLASSGIGLL